MSTRAWLINLQDLELAKHMNLRWLVVRCLYQHFLIGSSVQYCVSEVCRLCGKSGILRS